MRNYLPVRHWLIVGLGTTGSFASFYAQPVDALPEILEEQLASEAKLQAEAPFQNQSILLTEAKITLTPIPEVSASRDFSPFKNTSLNLPPESSLTVKNFESLQDRGSNTLEQPSQISEEIAQITTRVEAPPEFFSFSPFSSKDFHQSVVPSPHPLPSSLRPEQSEVAELPIEPNVEEPTLPTFTLTAAESIPVQGTFDSFDTFVVHAQSSFSHPTQLELLPDWSLDRLTTSSLPESIESIENPLDIELYASGQSTDQLLTIGNTFTLGKAKISQPDWLFTIKNGKMEPFSGETLTISDLNEPSSEKLILALRQTDQLIIEPGIPPLGHPSIYLPLPDTSPDARVVESHYILLNLHERRVYIYADNRLQASYPVAIGREGWETPTGTFEIEHMEYHPVWINPWTKEIVPAGQTNPLGVAWIGFWSDGNREIGFHGTPNPSLIGQAVSHGCVRMRNEDVLRLFKYARVGMMVRVVK